MRTSTRERAIEAVCRCLLVAAATGCSARERMPATSAYDDSNRVTSESPRTLGVGSDGPPATRGNEAMSQPNPPPSAASNDPTPSPNPPRRDIKPSPTQPPAEIDPVLPEPGDEVPH